MEQAEFNEVFRKRTKDIAVRIIQMYAKLPKSDELRIVGKQLIRSSTFVAANYRAACRARSKAEFAAKMSIVVEEADETLFWMEIREDTGLISTEKLTSLKNEATEILFVVSKARKSGMKSFITHSITQSLNHSICLPVLLKLSARWRAW